MIAARLIPRYPAAVLLRFALLAAPLLLANSDPESESKPPPQPIPPPIRAMLEAAMAADKETEVLTLAKYARDAAPQSAKTIDALVNGWRQERETKHEATLRNAGFFDLWRGHAELGGYVTTGNTQDIGVSGALDLTRESLRWRHKIHLAADYKESAGIVSRDHYLAAYEPNFKFSPRGYVYGAAQYESDRFLGYNDRYSTSLGAGYSAIKRPGMKLDLELGPAYRDTSFTDGTTESSFAARGSLDFDWKLTRAISISQAASAYVQQFNSTVSTTTSLNARLIGPLAAKFSYAVQYESMPPDGRVDTDTTSRASLVYNF